MALNNFHPHIYSFRPQSKHEFFYSRMKILYYAYVGISSLVLNICYNKLYSTGRPPFSPTPVTSWSRIPLSTNVTIWVDDVYLKPLPPPAAVCPRFAKSGPTPQQDDRHTSPFHFCSFRSAQLPWHWQPCQSPTQ
jgi:hypothetical protein